MPNSHDNNKFNKEVIQKIAKLAQLELSAELATEFSEQLSKIVAHFDEISSVDTQGVEPLITPSEIEYTLREDTIQKTYTAQDMVSNAPDKQGILFKVPPVV